MAMFETESLISVDTSSNSSNVHLIVHRSNTLPHLPIRRSSKETHLSTSPLTMHKQTSPPSIIRMNSKTRESMIESSPDSTSLSPVKTCQNISNSRKLTEVLKQVKLKDLRNASTLWKYEFNTFKDVHVGPLGDSQENYLKVYSRIQNHLDIAIQSYNAKRTEADRNFYHILKRIQIVSVAMLEVMDNLFEIAPTYDFVNESGVSVKSNGYRSLLFCCECIQNVCHEELQSFAKARSNRRYNQMRYFENMVLIYRLLVSIFFLVELACKIKTYSQNSSLFPTESLLPEKYMDRLIALPIEPFYGKYMGFQYSSFIRPALSGLIVGMASYYDSQLNADTTKLQRAACSIISGGQYLADPELRSKKIAEITVKCDIKFSKTFWSLSEVFIRREFFGMLGHSAAVSEDILIPAKPMEYSIDSETIIQLQPPCKGNGYEPIHAQLISYVWRTGQVRSTNFISRNPTKFPKSTGLIFHIHGGGFIAQSPKSHEMYLRLWSENLGVPVISIDYTLSPEGPYPRALDECIYSYAWVLMNLDKLGTTGEKIIFAGDSAGGNLAISTAFKAVSYGLRAPDSIILAYPALYVADVPSPSRLLSVMDPLLPTGILLNCLGAYTGSNTILDTSEKNMENVREILVNESCLSKRIKYTTHDDLFGREFIKNYSTTTTTTNNNNNDRDFPKTDILRRNSTSIINTHSNSYIARDSICSLETKFSEDSISYYDFDTSSLQALLPVSTNQNDINHHDIRANYSLPLTKKIKPPRPPPPKNIPTQSLISFSSFSIPEELIHNNHNPQVTDLDLALEENKRQLFYSVEHLATALDPKAILPVKSDEDSTPVTLDSSENFSSSSDDEQTFENIREKTKTPISEHFYSCEDSNSEDELDTIEKLLCERCKRVITTIKGETVKEKSFICDESICDSDTTEQVTNLDDPYLSPMLATPEMFDGLPCIRIIGVELDPLLDDSIEFAKKLRSIGHPVTLDIVQNLPHGFLAITFSSKSGPGEANEMLMKHMKQDLSVSDST